MKIDNRKKIKELIILFVVLGAVFAALSLTGYGCIIKRITGVSCPGCGMSRAWLALLRLDFKKAFYYHPLFIVPVIWLIMFIFKNHINEKNYNRILYVTILLFFVVYLVRMNGNYKDIVVFKPKEGQIYKLLSYLKDKIALQKM